MKEKSSWLVKMEVAVFKPETKHKLYIFDHNLTSLLVLY